MKRAMNLIIVLIVIFIIIISILLILIFNNNVTSDNTIKNNTIINNIYSNRIVLENNAILKNEVENNNITIDYGENYSSEPITTEPRVQEVSDQTNFYTVSNCVQRYIDDETITFTAIKMKVLTGDNTDVYSVYGKILKENEIGLGTDCYFIVKLCTKNSTFSVEQLENNYSSIEEIKLINDDNEILKKEDNTFLYYKITDEEVAKKYFRYYKNCMLYNQEEAYNLLDKAYREERFGSLDSFKKYIEEMKSYIIRSTVNMYARRTNNSYTIIDNYGNYYIFNGIGVMEYSVQLDNYTLETAIYVQKYESSSSTAKIETNIAKFINMINNRDYEHAYKLLNDTFKNENFKNIDSFISFIQDNTYEFNRISGVNHHTERRILCI